MIPVPQSLIDSVRIPGLPWMWLGGGWASDGHFAVLVVERGEAERHEDADGQARREDSIQGVVMARRCPLKERLGWRCPFLPGPGKIECRACAGLGKHNCVLCDHHHECAVCNGNGEEFDRIPRELGQIVLDGANGLVVLVAGRFAPLVDAAASVATAWNVDMPNQAHSPVVLLDAQERAFAVLMPLRGEPVEPKKKREVGP